MFRALLLSLFLLPSLSMADSAPPPEELDFSHAWFKPTLEENHSPHCAGLLRSAELGFFSHQSLRDELIPDGLQEQTGYNSSLLLTDGRSVYFNTYAHPGCGGGCAPEQIVASHVAHKNAYWAADIDLNKAAPRSSSPRLFLDANRQAFVLSSGSGWWQPLETLYLHQLKADLSWEEVCRISVAPQQQHMGDTPLQVARTSIGQLSATLGSISASEGDCGSLRPGERRKDMRASALSEILFRPWGQYSRAQSSEALETRFRTNSENLGRWALTGTSEFQSVRDYQAQLEKTTQVLTHFYQSHFGWQPQQARQVARIALLSAVNSGLAFPSSGYSPFAKEESTLRQAILERQPLERVRQLGGTISDLSIAIQHPQALQYLLEQGSEPNQTNPFGKTALMYAAQYNQLESARILLAKGAEPNATTIWPEDTCTYRLDTRNMTALHYAARYASPALIELLVEHGAATFIQTVTRELPDARTGTPLNWLKRHTAADAKEPNPNIPPQRVADLEDTLRVPDEPQLQRQARKLTLQAEQDYAQGHAATAYRALLLAREATPDDPRILSNLSLIALKIGEQGLALEAGQQLLDSSQDTKLLANAWYNQGLVCEQSRGWHSYNGTWYCRNGGSYPYFQAVRLESTAPRQAKLLNMLRAPKQQHCQTTYDEEEIHIVVEDGGGRKMLYVLYPSTITVNTGDISWQLKDRRVKPVESATLELGEWKVSLLESNEYLGDGPLQVAEATCTLVRD